MPVPKNFHGKKGRSGRRSAWDEVQDSRWHSQIWSGDLNLAELEDKIKNKRVFSGRDMAAYLLLTGDRHITGKFMDKLLPDLSRLVDKDGKDVLSVDELAQRIANIRAKRK